MPRTLYDESGYWLQMDSADPLDGWSIDEVRHLKEPCSRPANDSYGHLYLYLWEQFLFFHRQCQQKSVNLIITAVDMQSLGEVVPSLRFDRIDVSNVVDATYLGVGRTLRAVRPFLRSTNKCAVVVSLFMNTIGIIGQYRKHTVMKNALKQVQRYLPLKTLPSGEYDPEILRQMAAADRFLPFDEWFGEYCKQFRVYEDARAEGFEPRTPHTIIKPWPMRFTPQGKKGQDEENFKKLLGSSCTGAERYVEWRLTVPSTN